MRMGSIKSQGRASVLKITKKEMPYLREQYGVVQLALFGSFARGEATEDSDIDIMVSLSKPLGNEIEQVIGAFSGGDT